MLRVGSPVPVAAVAAALVVAIAGCGSDDAPTLPSGSGGAAIGGGGAAIGGGGAAVGGEGGAGAGTGAGGGEVGGGGAGGGFPAPVPDDCITDVTPADEHVFACDGLEYTVSVPAACIHSACGLIFDVHGFTMTAAMQEANTRLAELGRTHGYLVVQPTASGAVPGWNPATDDPKVFDFLERMVAAFHADPKRVHFTGFSQGGSMTWRFLCDHSDVIASVAPAAYGNGEDSCFSQGQAPTFRRPILYMHGTGDIIVPFSTAQASRDAVVTAQAMSVDGTVSTDGQHDWTRYKGPNGELFELIEHDYGGAALIGGHCFPGSTDPGTAPGQLFSFACDAPNAFTWGQAVLDFFMASPAP